MNGIHIFNAGVDFWNKVHAWALANDQISPSDLKKLDLAKQMPRKIPNEDDCIRLMEIRAIYES